MQIDEKINCFSIKKTFSVAHVRSRRLLNEYDFILKNQYWTYKTFSVTLYNVIDINMCVIDYGALMLSNNSNCTNITSSDSMSVRRRMLSWRWHLLVQ